MDFSTLKKPSAWLPIAMSLAALALVLGYLAIYGMSRRGGDEGTTAHTWQLLMAGQLPVILFYAAKWLPRKPKRTVIVLAVQAIAALAAVAPVYWLGL